MGSKVKAHRCWCPFAAPFSIEPPAATLWCSSSRTIAKRRSACRWMSGAAVGEWPHDFAIGGSSGQGDALRGVYVVPVSRVIAEESRADEFRHAPTGRGIEDGRSG